MFLVRSPWRSAYQEELYHKYKDEILFIGLSSFEDCPKPSVNPYSARYPAGQRACGVCGGVCVCVCVCVCAVVCVSGVGGSIYHVMVHITQEMSGDYKRERWGRGNQLVRANMPM